MTNETVDAKQVALVLEEIMLCICNPHFDIYSARDGAVNIIENFVKENSQIPFTPPSEEEYDSYAFSDEYEDEETETNN